MLIRGAVVLSVVGSCLLSPPPQAHGQEVSGDVKIPPLREVVIATPAASGRGGGEATATVTTREAYQAAIRTTVSRVLSGSIDEAEARAQLGDFTVSLLVKAGVISFDDSSERQRVSLDEPSTRGTSGIDPDGLVWVRLYDPLTDANVSGGFLWWNGGEWLVLNRAEIHLATVQR